MSDLNEFISDESRALVARIASELQSAPQASLVAAQVPLPDGPLEPSGPSEVAAEIPNVIPSDCCRTLVTLAESSGFRVALLSEDLAKGGYPDLTQRKAGMVRFTDHELAAALWCRLKPALCQLDWSGLSCSFPRGTSGWYPFGVNDSMRILRYVEGDYFKPHVDGGRVLSEDVRSFLSCIIYLNEAEEFDGGSTLFHPVRSNTAPTIVRPVVGCALCFDHNLYHEGEVLRSGIKYALRTDIMFRRSE